MPEHDQPSHDQAPHDRVAFDQAPHDQAPHDRVPLDEVAFDQAYWDDRYSSADTIWSGRPNPHLVTEVSDLAPGTALDVGSGEGGDAVWLARRGWTVTAVDLSEVALARAEAQVALQVGPQDAETAGRISWQHRDILRWSPAERSFALVSSQYSHFARDDMHALVARLAAAVAPGGTLLVVGHELHPQHTIGPDFFFTATELAGLLDPAEWEIVTAGLLPHPTRHGSDEVLRARRRAASVGGA